MQKNINKNCTTSALRNNDEMFFKELDAPQLSKNILITLSAVLPVLCVFGYLGIIWFERFGSDLKRICINRIMSSLCWTIIFWFIFVHPLDIIVYFHRPIPEFFCFYQVFLNQTLLLQCIWFYDAIAIVRFVLIFYRKNPQNFHDDFWYCFINIVTVISR